MPVIFGCFVAGCCVFKYLCLFVCVSARVYAHVCVLMCVLPYYLCIFRGTEIHTRKLKQAGANKALRFDELHTHGIYSICLPTHLECVRFFFLKKSFFKLVFSSHKQIRHEVGKNQVNNAVCSESTTTQLDLSVFSIPLFD